MGGTGSTQRQPHPLHLLVRSDTLVSFFHNRGTSILWRSYCEDIWPKNQLRNSKQQHSLHQEEIKAFEGDQEGS
eukprot:1143247-Pelagomonas_calceolata.AAC.5